MAVILLLLPLAIYSSVFAVDLQTQCSSDSCGSNGEAEGMQLLQVETGVKLLSREDPMSPGDSAGRVEVMKDKFLALGLSPQLIAVVTSILILILHVTSLFMQTHGTKPDAENAAIRIPNAETAAPVDATDGKFVEAVFWVSAWITCSIFMILSNKYLFANGFPHPLSLTMAHQFTCYAVFSTLRMIGSKSQKYALMPDADRPIPLSGYVKTILPIGLLNSYCVGSSNMAFMYSSVGVLQMIKPINILFVSGMAFLMGLESATMSHVVIIIVVMGGVYLSSFTATAIASTSIVGVVLQVSSCFCSGTRLALLQVLMTKDIKLDPVSTIFHEMPWALVGLSAACYFFEKPVDATALHGTLLAMLLVNIVMAVLLNVMILNVVKSTSAVAYTLFGIIKDIACIIVASFLFGEHTTPTQGLGYAVSIMGMVMYKTYKDNIAQFKELGLFEGAKRTWIQNGEK